ncbi:MAG: hypothetical protein WCN98_19585, partial [Verrucomicrobiaceae bacterium]
RDALTITSQAGFPAMFVAVPSTSAGDLLSHLHDLVVNVSTASVYAHRIKDTADWCIDTSEI